MMTMALHGGPASAVTARWGGRGGISAQAFSAMGYFVLQPNPRGSYGQGEAFTQANRKDFGYGDLRDILAGVDAVLAKYPVDSGSPAMMTFSIVGGLLCILGLILTISANWQMR